MRVDKKQIIPAGTAMASSITSSFVPVENAWQIAVVITTTGAATTGVAKLQFTCDDLPNASTAPINWADSGISVSITAAGSYGLEKAENGWTAFRVVYTQASGSGSILANACAKGF